MTHQAYVFRAVKEAAEIAAESSFDAHHSEQSSSDALEFVRTLWYEQDDLRAHVLPNSPTTDFTFYYRSHFATLSGIAY